MQPPGTVDVTHAATLSDHAPLVVDVHGSLVRTNLLWEGLAMLLRRRPVQVAGR